MDRDSHRPAPTEVASCGGCAATLFVASLDARSSFLPVARILHTCLETLVRVAFPALLLELLVLLAVTLLLCKLLLYATIAPYQPHSAIS